MKSKFLVVIAAMLVFGIGFAVYAFNSTTQAEKVSVSCCSCCGDSCPMKSADVKAAVDCCCKGDGASCPMKSKDAKVTISADGKDSCPISAEKHAGHEAKVASGDSCPMMKDGKPHEAHVAKRATVLKMNILVRAVLTARKEQKKSVFRR